jgi:hypothetical protein
VAADSTMTKSQEGRDSWALPAPRHTASNTRANVVKIAHFTCSEMA